MFFFGSLFPTFFLDKFGRRRPMMIGCALCGISMMLIAALLSPQGQGNEELAKRASSASVAFFFTVRSRRPESVNAQQSVHAVLRRHHELYPLGVRPRNSATPSQGQRHRDRHFEQLGTFRLFEACS